MYCPNCGEKMEEKDNFCIKCGTPKNNTIGVESNIPNTQISSTSINNGQQKPIKVDNISEEDNRKANLICTISLILTYGYSLFSKLISYGNSNISEIFDSFAGLAPLIGLVLMIYARVKYPNNKFAKVLMWIYIINVIIAIVGMIIIVATCTSMIQSCS